MDTLHEIIKASNDILWTYVLIVGLLACGIYFTIRSRFVQFRYLKEMFRLLGDKSQSKGSISSFQAFCISIAARVGTGNLAGVATAIAIGGAAAVFWMWVVAVIGAATGFIESALAQLYKRKNGSTFIGGPAYYMQYGMKKRWFGVIFAVLMIITYGLVFNSVQSNTIAVAFHNSFGVDQKILGAILAVATLVVVFGGVKRIARTSAIIVPVMALLYIAVAVVIVLINITELPSIIAKIVGEAFGFKQAVGGVLGAAVMQGVRRGLYSNEAGMGSTPNAAATADVSHPAKQGLVQALGVFTDTLIICSCTAFMIIMADVPLTEELVGIELTQLALDNHLGSFGGYFVAISILLFAFSSVMGNYYYGEANLSFVTRSKTLMLLYRLSVVAMVFFGAMASLQLVWDMADLTMALITITNLIAIVVLGKIAFKLLDDYASQRRRGIKDPIFKASSIKELENHDLDCWR